MSELTKEELMLCSKGQLVETVLLYQKMLNDLHEKIDEVCEAFGIKGGMKSD